MEGLALLIIVFGINGGVGYLIAKNKGRGTAGFWWGFFLGIIGWIIAACLEPSPEVKAQRMALQAKIIREAFREN